VAGLSNLHIFGFKQAFRGGLLWFRLFFAVFAAICQGAVFAVVFLTSLAIAVA
jgi:hypothetical protein